MHATRRLFLERLEERTVFALPPAGIELLPSVTIDLTADQIDNADAVIRWNSAALRAAWAAATSPTHASRVYAMVSTAVYGAVNAITPVAENYAIPGLIGKPAARASAEVAAIAAADKVLRSLYPSQTALFDAVFAQTMALAPTGVARTNGLAWGTKVADAIIAWRSVDDIRPTIPEYTPATAGGTPGDYQLTPNTTFALTPQWGSQQTWALTSGAQFLSPPPPALDSAQYAADFNEVKAVGGVISAERSADQTEFAHFWADVPGNSASPPGHMNQIAQRIALIEDLSLAENARLFAMLNIGLADAAINCWEAKYVYDFWRPVTAINDPRAAQINPRIESDPSWAPLWQTPPFPSYTSGHSTFSGATAAILTSFFGTNYAFSMGSDDLPGVVRSFTSFLDAAEEAAESRLYGGIHFRFDNEAGLTAGLKIGNFVAQNFLRSTSPAAYLQINADRRDAFNLFVSGGDRSDAIYVDRVGSRIVIRNHGRLLGSFTTGIEEIQVDARNGNDIVWVSQRITVKATLRGGQGNDVLYGGGGDDLLLGEEGNDTLYGFAGDDRLEGGDGRDFLFGGLGDDHLLGGDGVDYLYGELGADLLEGGAGDDWLLGGPGVDLLIGGTGRNRVYQ